MRYSVLLASSLVFIAFAGSAGAAPAKKSASEPSAADKFADFFRNNATANDPASASRTGKPGASAASQSKPKADAPVAARPATAAASAPGTDKPRPYSQAALAASYSTSSNSLGFGFYRVTPRETVGFKESHATGTIIVRQREKRLYYVLGNGQAVRYAIAVGREGAAWSGVSTVSNKREWPDWTPTPTILAHQPDLPRHMEGGPQNPLGARALYLGATMYRIHGTNEPWRIGEEVSSGCIRLSNEDIIDLYNRARIGATVIVQR